METKQCIKCRQCKSIEHFPKDTRRKDGRRSSCRPCDNTADAIGKVKHKDRVHNRYAQLKHAAKIRNMSLEITEQQYSEIIKDRECYYCDSNFSENWGYALNRVNSSEGYTLNNIKPCCGVCNRLMSDFTVEQLRSRLIKIYKRITKGENT